MEKKTMDALRAMICGELEDIAKKGVLSHETLDITKDLLDSYKNIEKIEKYTKEKESEWDPGYSQRKYYIDADYNPYGQNSYRGPMNYDISYARGGQSYMDGNSYMYPMYEQPMYANTGGYARAQGAQDITKELKGIMQETNDPAVKSAISEVITKVGK